MEPHFSKAEKVVGLFVVGVVVSLLTTLVILGRGKDWFAEEVTYYTSFKETYNLQVDAAVKLFKADIGRVERISLGADNVNVQLAVLARYASRIRQDAFAVVDSPTLIGSEYISIVPGEPDSPQIPVGGMIPSVEKKSIDDILETFEVEKTALLAVQTVRALAGLAEMMADPHGPLLTTLNRIERTTAHLEQITGNILEGQGAVGALVTSREMVDGALANLDKMNALLDSIQATASRGPLLMDQLSGNLATIQDAGRGVVENVDALKDLLNEARLSVDTIQRILNHLERGSQDIPQVTATARDGIREIREGVDNIDRVVQSLQRNLLIRSNLPAEPWSMDPDGGWRPE